MASEYVLRIPLDRHVITTQRSLAAVLEDIRRVLHDSASRSALQGHLVAAGHQVRLIIDRPDATAELVRCLPDAGAYCPATVLVQAAGDGACLAYDSVASAISPYQDEEALAVAELFDAEVLSLLRRVAEPAPGESGQ